jgi:iron complex outermembrane recepter protein
MRCDASRAAPPVGRLAVAAWAVLCFWSLSPARAVAMAPLVGAPGSIIGRIMVSGADAGSGLFGVELRLGRIGDGKAGLRVLSSAEGRFAFTDLAPDRYVLTAEHPGFEPHRERVEIAPGAAVEMEVALEPSFADAITVTATRSERRTEEVPAAVSVVGREQLEQTPMTNIKDALEGMPSTLIGSKNQGYDARLLIRGAGLKARYGIREIMVLLNGIPLTDPDSFTRLDFIDTQLIDRVEVVRGPNSTLWGINATGGTVNVITRSPGHEWGGSATADAGSYGASAFQLNYSGAIAGRHFLSVDASRREATNDWRPHNRFETSQLTLQPWITLGDGMVLENYVSYTEADIELPGSLVVSPRSGVDQWTPYLESGLVQVTADPWRNSGRTSDILFAASRLRTELGALRVEPLLFVNSWNHYHPVTGKINVADTLVGGIDVPVIWEHGGGALTGGLTARFDMQDGEAYTYADVVTLPDGRILHTESDRRGDLMESTSQDTMLYGVYAQESARLSERWLVDLGMRVDHIRFDVTGVELLAFDYRSGQYVQGVGDIDSVRDYTALSPRVAAVLALGADLHLYGNISTGAQTPTSSELTTNPDLDLTRVVNYELGLKGRFSFLTFDAAAYHAVVTNEVVQVVEGFGYTEYVNAGETEKNGLELSLTATPWLGLAIGGGYAYSDYTYVDFSEPAYGRNVDRSGNRLPYIPRHQYSVFAAYQHPSGLTARLSANTWGSYFVDNANSQTYGGYSLVTDLAVGCRWRWIEVMLMVQNLFDDRYAVEVQKDLYGTLDYSPAMPRSVRARATFRF